MNQEILNALRAERLDDLLSGFVIANSEKNLVISYDLDSHTFTFSLTKHGYIIYTHTGKEWEIVEKVLREFVILVVAAQIEERKFNG